MAESESIRALATVTLDARALDELSPQTIDRLAELVAARLREQAVQAPPRTYRSLVADPGRGRKDLPPPGRDKRVHPSSLEGEAQDRPWRRSSSAAPDLDELLR